VKSFAIEQTMDPTVNMITATTNTDFRSMMWEKEAHVGWKTVDVRRNDVPAQKAWIVVPWS